MRICVAGAYGAFGLKHLDALKNIEDIEVVSVMGPNRNKIAALANERRIEHFSDSLEECISLQNVDAIILSTPTQMHANQAIRCMDAGKHVLVEIPMADTLVDSNRIGDTKRETGLVCMAGHVRRFNPSHQWINNKLKQENLKLNKWMHKPTSFVEQILMQRVNQDLGPIIYFGIMPVIRLIYSSTKHKVKS